MKRTLFSAVVLCLAAGTAASHSWYPPSCCHDQDCAPAVLTPMPDGHQKVVTIHGAAIVPPWFEVKESQDHLTHACIRPDGTLICLFIPPSN